MAEPTYQPHPQETFDGPPAGSASGSVPQSQPPQPAAQTSVGQTPSLSSKLPHITKPEPEEMLLEWQAPSRPFRARKKQFFSTIIIIALLVSAILVLAGQGFLPVAVIFSVVFLVYVLSVIPPGVITNSLTTYGIRVEGNLYYWEELGRFWFTEKHGATLLHIEVARFPGRLTLLLGNDLTKADMKSILSEVLLFQKPKPTYFELAANKLQELLPLEANEMPSQHKASTSSPPTPATPN